MKAHLLWAALLVSGFAHAADWRYSAPIPVTRAAGPRIFHHLESAGRKNIAVARDSVVAVTWEDNRDGTPRVYAAFKLPDTTTFSAAQRVSGTAHAGYEPAITALPDGRFLLVWEEHGGVWARAGTAGHWASAKLLAHDANEASVIADDGRVYGVWSQRRGHYSGIECAELHVTDHGVAPIAAPRPVDPQPLHGDQLYPSVAVAPDGLPVVAWEDRRLGHTVIMATHGDHELRFAPPTQINETHHRLKGRGYGGGTGAMRVTLARAGRSVIALWMDKRDFTAGYKVYVAISTDDGAHFGKNEKVSDDFGDDFAQWHGALAADGSRKILAVWDDNRDGTSDLWMAQRRATAWSDNAALRGASGDGNQSSPAIAFDRDGNLHVVWIEKPAPDAPDRLEYMVMHRAR